MNSQIFFCVLLQLSYSYSWGQTLVSRERYVENGVLDFSIWKIPANGTSYLKENLYLDAKGNIIRHDYVSSIMERQHQCYFSYDSCNNVVWEKWIDSSTKDSSGIGYSYTYQDCKPTLKRLGNLVSQTSYDYDSDNKLKLQVTQYSCDTANQLSAIFRKDLDFLNWRGHDCGFEMIRYCYSNGRLTSTVKTKHDDGDVNLPSIETYRDTIVYSAWKANFTKYHKRNNFIQSVLRCYDGNLIEILREDESIHFVYNKLGLLTEELHTRLNKHSENYNIKYVYNLKKAESR